MWTQILVRSAGSPLALLHTVGQQVNSIDADQQISGQAQDLEHWIQDQPEVGAGTSGCLAIRFFRGFGAGARGNRPL